jgi:hypothetical protein
VAARGTRLTELTQLLQTQGPCTAPLDSAVEYIRIRFDRVLAFYLVAMIPHAVVINNLIGAVVLQRRSWLTENCILLIGATIWRWIWLAALQFNMQSDLGVITNAGSRRFFRRLPAILQIRLLSHVTILWAGWLIIPAFYGVLIGSFAAPLLLESDEPAWKRIRAAMSWIHHSGSRLTRISFSISALLVLLIFASFIGQLILSQTALPSLLNIDTADLSLTLASWSWRLTLLYLLLLLLDAFWTVASVMIYYDSQSRRLATDLRFRVQNLTEASA